jgi:uncharacterized protein
MPSSEPAVNSPVPTRERIDVIDMVRGFAIFGILVVNMIIFGTPVYSFAMGLNAPETLLDQAVALGIRFFAESKFYSLFSMLFGLGLTIQMTRSLSKGKRFVPLYLRRLAVLLVIGLVHAFVFWPGDILVMYAVLGVLLIFFRNAKPRTLLIWSAVCVLLPVLITAALMGLIEMGKMQPEGAAMVESAFQEQRASLELANQHAMTVYTQGSWVEQFSERAAENFFMYGTLPIFGPSILAMFLLGMAVGKAGILQDIPANIGLIRRVQVWGGIIGVVGNLLGTVMRAASPVRFYLTPMSVGADAAFAIGAPALSLFYASTIILLVQNPVWKEWLAPLASVGRMALSNYLLQTLICTTIFYNYGLGLYGQVGHALGLVLTVLIYALQIPLSLWWLRRFEFGPMEWLWRSLTYGKRQPMRLLQPGEPVVRVA